METKHEWIEKLITLFELQEFLQVIERDENGNPKKIGDPAFSTPDKMRLAENIKDFEEIYNRELKTVSSNIINISSYITRCKKRVNDKVEVYEKMCEEGKHKQDDKLLDTAVSYVIFLESKISLQQNLDVSLTVPTPQNEQNPFDKIFTGSDNKTFVLFETFAKRHVIDKYIDFSFIFQQMKFNGYIADIKHIKFMDWLHQKDYLTDEEHSDFKVEKCFRSLKKCSFGTRVDLYIKLQNDIILSNSDLSE